MDSLARPGGNATGFSIVAPELGTKRLELLKEIVPNLSSIAVLPNAKNPQSKLEMKEMQTAAQAMGLQLYPAEISTVSGLEDAFVEMNKAAAQALSLTDPILFGQRKRTVDLASEYKLPAVHFIQDLSKRAVYGPSDVDLFRRAAGYVDRIVKGPKPAELPVEQPTKFELTFNLKTAKALGLTVPQRLANGRNVYPVLRCRSRPSDHFDLLRSLPRNPNWFGQFKDALGICLPKIMSRSAPTLRRIIIVAAISAVPSVRASGRLAAGHPVPGFVAADQVSDLVDRLVGCLGLDCSYYCLQSFVIDANRQCPWPMMRSACAQIQQIAT